MKEIKLMYGGYIQVDDEDFWVLNKYQWYKKETAFYYYAIAFINNRYVYMHKMLIKKEPKTRILHINGNGLDNRRSNLRLCTYEEYNKHNQREGKYTPEQAKEANRISHKKADIKRRDSGARSEYYKQKRKNDIAYRIKSDLYVRLWRILKSDKQTNRINLASMNLVGCSKIELMDHLQSKFREGMHWGNHSVTGWQIDHIIPISAFDLTDRDQRKKCFHYTNLQPLWMEENIKKGKKIINI